MRTLSTTILNTMLLGSLAACVTEDPTDGTAEDVQDLYGLGTATRFGDTNGAVVPICFDDNYSYATLHSKMQEFLTNTWSSYANIDFVGWGACAGVTARKVHIVWGAAGSRATTGNAANGDKVITIPGAGATDNDYAGFRSAFVHEIGHALGFAHEMQRPDNWQNGTALQCPPVPGDEGNYDAAPGGIYLTDTYDVDSIMNYCRPGDRQDLSLGDVSGVRKGYGRRDVKGDIYQIDSAGELHWYRHDGRTNGSFTWAGASGSVVGHGWNLKQVFSGGGSLGILYTVDSNNTLRWYRHDARTDGAFRWTYQSGATVGTGWNFATLFGAGNDIIYGITPYVPARVTATGTIPASGGDLKWYRHDGQQDGSFKWAPGSGNVVGTRWDQFQTVFSGGDNIIYAVTAVVPAHYETVGGVLRYVAESGGDLKWYRHTGSTNGSFTWAAGSGNVIGKGWGHFKRLFSGGDGVIYAINSNDQLVWYRHDGRETGSFTWAAGSGNVVGTGWTFAQIFGDD